MTPSIDREGIGQDIPLPTMWIGTLSTTPTFAVLVGTGKVNASGPLCWYRQL